MNFRMVKGKRKAIINDFENYEINEIGDVFLLNKYLPDYNIYPSISNRKDRAGYRTIRLNRNGKSYTKYLHRLIAEHFIPNPFKLPEVNHKDGNKLNNSAFNLEWVSHRQNVIDAYQKGLNSAAKQVKDIQTGNIYHSISEACRATGLNFNTASKYIKCKPDYRLQYVG
jgi:hypothetical protein